ncbi:MAG: DsbA family protein [Deltaproteobacteria bacterium]|nr:DsbA family protein [Deltaproteobacteria bacterium]
MSKTVHVFSDYACPWCYLGVARLRKAAGDAPVDVVLLPFPLSPDTPEEGRALRPYLEARGMDVDAARERLGALLAEAGLPWNTGEEEVFAYNTSRAQELAVWVSHHAADSLGPLHEVLFRMVQVENRNVWDLEVLREAANEVGVDADAAVAALTEGTYRDEVLGWWSQARQLGVRGVPTFIAGGRGVSGAQPVETLAQFLQEA